MLLHALFDDTVRHGQHLIYKGREGVVFGGMFHAPSFYLIPSGAEASEESLCNLVAARQQFQVSLQVPLPS